MNDQETNNQQDEQSPHEIAVENQPRDSHGHFAEKIDIEPASHPSPQSVEQTHPLINVLKNNTSVSHTTNDSTLLDIHIGNPLRKITQLLEDIKKQKAFSFTLKGSLGIAGVALALSFFGIFGSAKMLCDKGIQTQVGMVKQLTTKNIEQPNVNFIDNIINLLSNQNMQTSKKRIILLKDDHSTIYLPYLKEVSYSNFLGRQIYITGQFNSCSQTLTPTLQNDIEPF